MGIYSELGYYCDVFPDWLMFNTIQLITYKIFSETIVASSLLDILVLFRTGSILLFCSFTLTSIHLRIAGTTFKSFPSLLVTSPITTTDEQMKIKFFYYVDCFFLSDHNFISNEENLIISFVIERYC